MKTNTLPTLAKKSDDIYTFTIESGDLEGAPPYEVTITDKGDSQWEFTTDGKPFLNQSGKYLKTTDAEQLREYAQS